jgi:hypothetical protein
MPTCGAGTTGTTYSATTLCQALPGYTPPTLSTDGSVYTSQPVTTPTVSALAARVAAIIANINTVKTSVSTNNVTDYISNQGTGQTATRLSDLKREELSADTAFREAEAAAQASGLQGRKRTLQEFIITFFFIAFLVLTITLMIRSYTILQDWNEAFKILGLMTIVYGCIWGILVRYA